MSDDAVEKIAQGEDLLSFVLSESKKLGATDADAIYVTSDDYSISVRKGDVEKVNRSLSRGMGIRVFRGESQAIVSTSDLNRNALSELVREAVRLAGETAPDPYAGLPDPADLELHRPLPDLLLEDDSPEPSSRLRLEIALSCEKAALSYDSRIASSEGAEFQSSRVTRQMGNTRGFLGGTRRTNYALSVTSIAKEGDSMERDYWYDQRPFFRDLDSPEAIGTESSRRAIRRLHPKRPPTGNARILFDPENARSLIGHFLSAISGHSLYRDATYLKGREGTSVASGILTITEDPFLPGGFGSRPFDGEGVRVTRKEILSGGVLNGFLFDTYSARKTGHKTTGNAVRSLGDSPSVGTSNILVTPGSSDRAALLKQMGDGILVTELIGFGVNTVTGDYSRGAFGYDVRGGEIMGPLSEFTIAGTLDSLFLGIIGVGSDLSRRSSIICPSILVEGLRVSGI
ncbi:MAG: TldD/PmbA family protein [Leptospirillum sp.]